MRHCSAGRVAKRAREEGLRFSPDLESGDHLRKGPPNIALKLEGSWNVSGSRRDRCSTFSLRPRAVKRKRFHFSGNRPRPPRVACGPEAPGHVGSSCSLYGRVPNLGAFPHNRAVRGPPSFAKLGIDLNFSESLTDASLLPISVQLLPSAMPSRPAGSGKMSWTARLQKSSTFRRRKHLPSECLFVSGVSLLSKSFWPQATEDAGQEAPQAVGHAAGHLGRLTLRLPRDDTDVSWTSPLFSESGSQCPAGLQSRNT